MFSFSLDKYPEVELLDYMVVMGGFPGGASGKDPTCHCRKHETRVPSLSRENPLQEGMATTPVFLPGESHGPRSLAGYSP